MFGWFKKAGSFIKRPQFKRLDRNAIPSSKNNQRDWKAATDSDSTISHWGKANGLPINSLLSLYLEKIISRASYESRANPIIDGTINSHANDVIGPMGPKLQFQTDDDSWNSKAESLWKEVAQSIDASGELSLAAFLKQGIRSFWTTGAMLSQYVVDTDCDTAIKHRLHTIPMQQLYSQRFNNDDTMLGITRNKYGRPTKYWILESGIDVSSTYAFAINPIEVSARDIQHVYQKFEVQQWRGLPWLSSCLQAIAELDEYDTAVLDAAKVAAMMAVLLYNTRDDIDSDIDPKQFEIRRQSVHKVGAGWQPFELHGNQPTAMYPDFKADKLRDVGRSVGMPLMSIQRDASKHNYSSARFDGQGYARANESIQKFLEEKSINPFVSIFVTEGMLRGVLPYKDPKKVAGRWNMIWTPPPHIDPVKEAMAQRIQMENRTLSPQRACRANDVEFEDICKEFEKANEILKSHGLLEFVGPIPTDPAVLAAILADEKGANDAKPSK